MFDTGDYFFDFEDLESAEEQLNDCKKFDEAEEQGNEHAKDTLSEEDWMCKRYGVGSSGCIFAGSGVERVYIRWQWG